MRTRLFLATVCMLALPLCFSASPGDKGASSPAFGAIAYAGHVITGGWCECGSAPTCFCDPGEEPMGREISPVPDQTKSPVDQGILPIRTGSGFDLGTGALMLALALFMWIRLRA